MLTCHESANADESRPFLWSYANHTISKIPVKSTQINSSPVTSVAVSQCGNFGILGFQNGVISKFSMQTGKDKGVFTVDMSKFASSGGPHTDEVTGLGLDVLNRYMVSCSLDKTIKLWDFYRTKLSMTYTHSHPIDNLFYNRQNDLVAFSSSELSISILNVKTGLKKVRYFPNAASNKITDICFSQPDAKWLICSSMDKCIRVWDIVTGSLIDWVQFKDVPLSIDFSPSGEYLATSHLGSKAVYLWANKAFFQ